MKYTIKKHAVIETVFEVEITQNDVFNWMTECSDAEILRHLARYANRRARIIENPPEEDYCVE